MFRKWLIRLPRRYKRALLAVNDLLIIEICLLTALSFRLDWNLSVILESYWVILSVTPLPILLFLYRSGLYASVTRFSGGEVFAAISRGVSFGTLVVLLIFFLFPTQPQLPRSVLILSWFFCIVIIFSSRIFAGRWLHGNSLSSFVLDLAGVRHSRNNKARPVIIYGAGAAGRQLARALQDGGRFLPLAFIDDDPKIQGEVMFGLKVYRPDELPELSSRISFSEVFLAMPSIPRNRRGDIIRFLEPFDVHVRSVPSMEDLAAGIVSVEDVREVEVADILGREAVLADRMLLAKAVAGKNILVTGAGGSIGSELCRQIFRFSPDRIILLDHSEYNLYRQCSELEEYQTKLASHTKIIPVIGSVTDYPLVRDVLSRNCICTIFHAAAYKHVPLVEANGYQGFCNNVMGTLRLAIAAVVCGVDTFVLISTDKAVRPTNLMGASKRLAELLLQAFSESSALDLTEHSEFLGIPTRECILSSISTRFKMVRFGNVLDSSGSVIPKFRKQIKNGGPVTVTHPDVTRYFMTIPEAAQLVIQASTLGEGGEVFILDMGKPIRIDDLARKLIHLSGLSVKDEKNPVGDIAIMYTGIRPGEKLYEELLVDDNARSTSHPKIWRAAEGAIHFSDLIILLEALNFALQKGQKGEVTSLLSRPEIGYRPSTLD